MVETLDAILNVGRRSRHGRIRKSLIESNHRTVAVFPEVLEVTAEGDYRFALATQQSWEEMDRIHAPPRTRRQ